MRMAPEGNKAKTARRVIEGLEFFDAHHREATVMDIVRRYNRPQSSTSELLASLVELGLLYKDPSSRSYTLTPRAAILGSLSQPLMVRDGSLATLIDRLVAHTGLAVALFGMVGLNTQIFRWSPGTKFQPSAASFGSGAQDMLCASAAGPLLLSTLPASRRDGTIRRLNAEAAEDSRFSPALMIGQVAEHGSLGYAVGPAGFASDAETCVMLLPHEGGERPMALGFVYQRSPEIDARKLVGALQNAIQRCFVPDAPGTAPLVDEQVSSAA